MLNKKQPFTIIAENVGNINFSSLVPDIFFMDDIVKVGRAVGINVKCQCNETKDLYYIVITVEVRNQLDDKRCVSNLLFDFCVIVQAEYQLDEEATREWLTERIPQVVYPKIQEQVYRLTQLTGDAIKLPDYSFHDRLMTPVEATDCTGSPIENIGLKGSPCFDSDAAIDDMPVFTDEPESSALTMGKIFDRIVLEEDGDGFIRLMKTTGKDLDTFEGFALNRVLFKFFAYTDYQVCAELADDDYAKRLMFNLMASSSRYEWSLCKNEAGLTELKYFDTEDGTEGKLSDLTPDEFVDMAVRIAVEILTFIYVELFLIMADNDEFFKDDEVKANPTLDEYRQWFGRDDLSDEQMNFVDSLYEKINKTKVEHLMCKL